MMLNDHHNSNQASQAGAPAFPPWMPAGVRPSQSMSYPPPPPPLPLPPSQSRHLQSNQQQQPSTTSNSLPSGAATKCPELVWRQIRWPATEAGSLARAPCPSHALSGNIYEPFAASFACLNNGHWAQRVSASRCQSLWLRNLTQRLEVGESPLAALGELAQKTRSSSSTSGLAASSGTSGGGSGSLFGDDLVEIGRILRHLVSEQINEWLLRITDDKQRISFGRDSIQVSIINNI